MPREDGDPIPEMASFTPGLNGSRFRLVKFPPATEEAELDAQAVMQEVNEKAPGDWNFEADAPGMHTTDTVDYGVVISGEISLILDDGAAVSLGQGDTLVQNGTRRAWHNTGSEPCLMAFVMIGAATRLGDCLASREAIIAGAEVRPGTEDFPQLIRRLGQSGPLGGLWKRIQAPPASLEYSPRIGGLLAAVS